MTMHFFAPDRFHTTLGPHEPVLRIADGDTVAAKTVDAHGFDWQGEKVAVRPNPLTGPFYIEGAEPGDTLAVRFDCLTPIRAWGFTSSILAPDVVEPRFARELPAREWIRWRVDTASGTATQETHAGSLGPFTVPLEPMVGCFGVAPSGGQALSSATSGPHGGNMDYRNFREGVTAYLPVAVPGALFFLGDGHAAQGDGEIVGTGIETAFEMQFTVRVIKGKQIAWPRGEDDASIFAVGNARPLELALQYATTEMVRWLQEDYGLDLSAISLMLGQCVRYDIGNVYDPAYTMACKLEKRWIQS
jgi:acetamidase/formamidase